MNTTQIRQEVGRIVNSLTKGQRKHFNRWMRNTFGEKVPNKKDLKSMLSKAQELEAQNGL